MATSSTFDLLIEHKVKADPAVVAAGQIANVDVGPGLDSRVAELKYQFLGVGVGQMEAATGPRGHEGDGGGGREAATGHATVVVNDYADAMAAMTVDVPAVTNAQVGERHSRINWVVRVLGIFHVKIRLGQVSRLTGEDVEVGDADTESLKDVGQTILIADPYMLGFGILAVYE